MSSNLYSSLLAQSGQMPASFLRAAFTAAVRERNTNQLAALASRSDLPSDVLDDLAALPDRAVAAACRARTVIPGAHRTTEWRPTVLAAALNGSETSAEAFIDARDAFMAKPCKSLREALARTPANWFTPEEAAVLLRTGPAEALIYVRDFIARAGRDVAHELLDDRARSDAVLLRSLTDFAVSTDKLLDAWVAHLSARDRRRPIPVNELHELVNDICWRREESEAALLLTGLRSGLAADHPVLAAAVPRGTPPGNFRLRAWDTSPAAPPTVASALANANERTVVAAASTADLGTVREVVARVVTDLAAGFITVEAIRALLHNPLVTGQLLTDLLAAVTATAPNTPGHSALSTIDAVAIRPGNEQVAQAWCVVAPRAVLQKHGWLPFGGRAVAVELLNLWHASRSDEGWQVLAQAAWVAGLSDDQLRAAPAAMVDAIMANPLENDSAASAARALARVLSTGLGTSEITWLTFEEIHHGFDGTLEELMAVAVAATA